MMKEEEVVKKIDEFQQNQRQVRSCHADHDAEQRQRNYPQIGREIS
jgi:hypothetical protein